MINEEQFKLFSTLFNNSYSYLLQSLALQVLLTILLISCTASLTVRAVQLSKWFGVSSHDSTGMYYKSMVDEYKINAAIVIVALVSRYLYQRLRTLFANSIFLSVNKLKPFLRVQSDQPSFDFFPKSGATGTLARWEN